MQFEFLKGSTLEEKDFQIDEAKAYVKGFLYSNSMTLLYSPPKQGKTWLGYAIANFLKDREDVRGVVYVDMDNSISNLHQKNIYEKLIKHAKINYVSRAKTGVDAMAYLRKIDAEAVLGNFKDVVFVFETTKDFVDTDSKSQSEDFMKIMMRIRDAGATVIIMHHATKTGKTISGVQVFINSPDNVYEMMQKAKEDDRLHFVLNSTYSRTMVEDLGVSVCLKTLSFEKLDEVYATMSEYEEEFVRKGKEILKKNPDGLNKSQLLEALGYERTDPTARSTLDKFIDKIFKSTKIKNQFNITLL